MQPRYRLKGPADFRRVRRTGTSYSHPLFILVAVATDLPAVRLGVSASRTIGTIRWEGAEPLPPGKHTLEFDFKYDGLGMGTLAFGSVSGIGRGGTGVLKVDGKEVATQKMEHTLPFILQWDENLDVGSDTGTPVDDKDYQVPFKFTGKLIKVTLAIDRPKLSPEDIKKLESAQHRKKAEE